MPFVACNELAIATKSIASVLPHERRLHFVENCPYLSGRARRVKQHIQCMCCSQSERGGLRCANAEVQTREKGGSCIYNKIFFRVFIIKLRKCLANWFLRCDFEMTSSIVRFLIIFAIKIQLPTDLWWGVVFLHI